MSNKVQVLINHFCPYGYLDLEVACNIGDQVWLVEEDIFDCISEYKYDCWINSFEDIDPVYCVMDYILWEARSYIEEVTGYDFLNDDQSDGEIYTYSNYLATQYDYTEYARDRLAEKVQKHFEQLDKNLFCRFVFSQLEIRG